MANVYYKIDGNNIYYTNEAKSGYELLDSHHERVSLGKEVIIELYNDKFIFPENAWCLFTQCTNSEFDTSHWETSQCTNMEGLFSLSSNLTSLDLSSFDVSNVTNFSSMFWGCTNLREIKIQPESDWSLSSSVSTSTDMFYDCDLLPNFNPAEVDIRHANNTTPTGYFGEGHYNWVEHEVYVKTSEGWIKVEVML